MRNLPGLIIAALLVLNLGVTYLVARSEQDFSRKAIGILMTWLAPILGAGWAFWDLRARKPSSQPVSHDVARGPHEAAPLSLELGGQAAFELQAHLMDGNGLPILDFAALDTWAAQASSDHERRAAVSMGRRAWLLHVRDALGGGSHLTETAEAWVVSSYPERMARAAAAYITATRQRIARLLEGLASFREHERSILIVFDNEEDYYQYVANYYRDDGEFAVSGGMFINAGCPHFVMVMADLSAIEPVIAHEMTHSALAHLGIPLWLDEGIAVNSEHQLAINYRSAQQTLELLEKHRRFWTAETIQEFWSGDSFHRTDDGNALSYDLARAMVALAGRQWDAFRRFVNAAQRSDSGAAAAHQELGLELGALAASAIGLRPREDWTPRPGAWEHVSTKAIRPPKPGPCAPCDR